MGVDMLAARSGGADAWHGQVPGAVPGDSTPSQSDKEMTMAGFLKEFKEFAMRGNVVDMAVGIIIGAAFGKVVTSLVEKVMMPPLGYVMSGVDFATLGITLPVKTEKGDPVVIGYGDFLNTTINFIIVAFALFLVIKGMNTLKRKEKPAPAGPPEPPADVKLLTEIRDLLKKA
jgi:large conductance mechanosensitive channel